MQKVFIFLLGLGMKLIGLLPVIDFVMPDGMVSACAFMFQSVAFFLPVSGLLALWSVKMAVWAFRFGLSIIKFIIEFLPGF